MPWVRSVHCSPVSSGGSRISAVLSSRQKDGMTTRCSASMARVRAATRPTCSQVASHSEGPRCSPQKMVPAETLSPRRVTSSVSRAGSVGR